LFYERTGSCCLFEHDSDHRLSDVSECDRAGRLVAAPAVTQAYRLPTARANQGATSGIVVDNVASTTAYPQASSLYLVPQQRDHGRLL
jgi:hypothetical protein